MGTEGYFDFTNGAVINTDIQKNRVKDVINHELIHARLYTETTFGQFILMMQKNDVLYTKANMIKEMQFDYMNRMQERIAVNSELLSEYADNGKVIFDNAINSLKMRNKTYYNYFRKMCCVNGMADSEEKARFLVDILMLIGKFSLNIDLSKIPFESFNEKKDYQRFMSKYSNNIRYNPNRRFETIINILFRNNCNDNDISAVVEGSIDIDDLDKHNIIHNIAYEKAVKVYKDSEIEDKLIERIKTIGVQEHNVDENVLGIRPRKLDKSNEINVDLVSSKEEFFKIINDYKISEVVVGHRMSGFEEWNTLSINYSKKNKKYISYLVVYENDGFYRILSELKCTIIFDKLKVLMQDGKSIRKMITVIPQYIYVDVCALSIVNQIENYFYAGEFTFYENNGCNVIVVHKNSQILLMDIVSDGIEVLKKRWKNKIRFVELDSFSKDMDKIKYINDKCHSYELISFENIKFSEEMKSRDYFKNSIEMLNILKKK